MTNRNRTYNLTADGSTFIGKAQSPDRLYTAYLSISGTFGSGTVTVQTSADGGTTKLDLEDAGSAITATADKNLNIQIPATSFSDDAAEVYLTVSGSSSPDIDVVVID